MNAKTLSVRAIQAALLAGMVVASGSAFGQQSSDILIEAVRPTTVMRNSPNAVVSLKHHISYADLDLATQKGDRELEKRINEAATAVCKRLDALVPPEKPEDTSCVKKAVDSAMVQARAAISAVSAAAVK